MSKKKFDRNEAVEQGHQVDITDHVNKAGLLIPTYVTKKLWYEVIKLDSTTTELNIEEDKRVKEVISRLVYFIRTHRQSSRSALIHFNIEFSREGERQNYDLVSHIGVIDDDNSDPCITLFMSGEGQTQ